MARWANRWGWALVMAGVAGCNHHEDADAPRNVNDSTPPPAQAAPPDAGVQAASGKVIFRNEDRLHQPFAKAVRQSDDPPDYASMPPDETLTKKKIFRILEQVKVSWESIPFATPEGKRIDYTAVVETALGNIEIILLPDVAPNHVRSFVALAQAGYYDGLAFDRIQFQDAPAAEDAPAVRLEQIEAGNPRGLEEINGTVGYWLWPEFDETIVHEGGTVGACHDLDPSSAGCRFYITLTKDPFLDGNYTVFGKVATGLDVARRIYAQPVMAEDQDREGLRRPMTPTIIKHISIRTHIVEGARFMEGAR